MADNEKEELNSGRLAKNTLYLYARLILTLLVSLYTSRVILRYLGVEDFGIYNAVAGVVSMFNILTISLSASISRNLTFELGKGNYPRLHKVFCTSVNVQLIIIGVVLLLAETVGVWFLNNRMVIPAERMIAANWVFQFALLIFVASLISVPYNASIIAHERMKLFAYIGIVDVLMKLGVVFLLAASPIDKLIYYSILLLLVAIVVCSIYVVYCKKNFEECKFEWLFEKNIFKEMFGFASWNFIGSSSVILRTQGLTVLINLFFGPIANTARAIGVQVNNAVNGFVANFMTALRPQITKAYAQENFDYLLDCIYRGSKLSFFLLYFISLPIMVETEYILELWLGEVPDITVWFVRYSILYSLSDTYSRSLITANDATGDIKLYQIVLGGLCLLVVPIAYVVMKLGGSAQSSVLVAVIVMMVSLFPRIYLSKRHFPIRFTDYTKKVLIPTILVFVVGFILPYFAHTCLEKGLFRLIVTTLVSVVSSSVLILFMGCDKDERMSIVNFVKGIIKK